MHMSVLERLKMATCAGNRERVFLHKTMMEGKKTNDNVDTKHLDEAVHLTHENDQVSAKEDNNVSKTSPSPSRLKCVNELEDLEATHVIANQKELVTLQRLDDKSAQLQQEGRYTEALECMEKGLVLRQHFFGAESPEVWASCRIVGEMCNLLAMTYLQQEEFRVVLELLQKAAILTERHPAGRAVTLNNFACYYRRQGQLQKALTHLTAAFEIESKLDNLPNKADTHLNMCAVLSQLGKHQSALNHAQSALIYLHEELQLGQSRKPFSDSHRGKVEPNGKLDRIAVLGIAYHNVGVEQEFLKCWDQSLQSYKQGLTTTSAYLGEAHGIVVTLQNSLLSAKRNMAAKLRTNGTRGDGISLPNLNNARKFVDIKPLGHQRTKTTKIIRAKDEYPTKLPFAHSNNNNQ